jgi:hypothetical protein
VGPGPRGRRLTPDPDASHCRVRSEYSAPTWRCWLSGSAPRFAARAPAARNPTSLLRASSATPGLHQGWRPPARATTRRASWSLSALVQAASRRRVPPRQFIAARSFVRWGEGRRVCGSRQDEAAALNRARAATPRRRAGTMIRWRCAGPLGWLLPQRRPLPFLLPLLERMRAPSPTTMLAGRRASRVASVASVAQRGGRRHAGDAPCSGCPRRRCRHGVDRRLARKRGLLAWRRRCCIAVASGAHRGALALSRCGTFTATPALPPAAAAATATATHTPCRAGARLCGPGVRLVCAVPRAHRRGRLQAREVHPHHVQPG